MTGDDRKLALVIGVALVLALAVWLVTGDDEDATGALPDRRDGSLAVEVTEAVGARRESVNPVGAAVSGTEEDAARLDEGAPQEGPRPDLEVVLTWRGGGPVAGRAVLVRGQGGRAPHLREVTDEDGIARFHIDESYFDVFVPPSVRERAWRDRAGTTKVVRLALDPETRVSGRVVTPEGVVVDGAGIFTPVGEGENPVVLARTDAAGRFEIAGVGGMPELLARSDGRVESTTVRATPGEETVLVLGDVETPVAFAVCDPHGLPAAGAFVALVEHPGVAVSRQTPFARHVPRFGITDEAGRVAFEGLGGGWFAWCVEHADGAPALGELTVEPDRPVMVDVPLTLGVALVGTVRDADQRPIVGGFVAWTWKALPRVARKTHTENGGRFRLEGIPVGRQMVRVEFVNQAVVVELDGKPGEVLSRDLVLPGRHRLTGRCIDVRGEGVPHLEVVVRPLVDVFEGARRTSTFSRQRSPDVGIFVVDVTRAPSRIQVFDRDGAILVELPWKPEDGEVEIVIPERLVHAGSIRGRLEGAVAGARDVLVGVVESGGSGSFRSLGTEDRFCFGGLGPGAYDVVCIEGGGFPVVVARVDLAADEEVDLGRLAFDRPTAEVVVDVVGATGSQLAATTVVHRAFHGTHVARRVRDAFVFEGVPAGTFRFHVVGASAARGFDVAVTSGETTRVTVPFTTGRVCSLRRDAADVVLTAAGSARIVAEGGDGEVAVLRWPEGAEDVGPLRLASGAYELRLLLRSGILKTISFEVPEGVGPLTIDLSGT